MIETQDIWQEILRRKKWLSLLITLPTLTVLIINLILPKLYLSETSILPANSRLGDKARFFGEEISELYSAYGSYDDLDRLYATARSSALLYHIVDSFNLTGHYRLQQKRHKARMAAVKKLRSLTHVKKSEYGELIIQVWDRDSLLAASIANGIVSEIRNIHQQLYVEFYSTSLKKLESAYTKKLDTTTRYRTGRQEPDSADGEDGELNHYRKTINEFRMAVNTPPPVLLVLDKAIPAVSPDKPDIALNTAAAGGVSIITGLFLIIFFRNSDHGHVQRKET
jgi:capsular polysaccharide biosynthesis protein